MITVYTHVDGRLDAREFGSEANENAVWIDLDHPSLDEIRAVENRYGIDVPSADDMREIEVSSRLYQEGAAHVMTASIVYRIETRDPQSSEITFMLLPKLLVTVRFANPRAFPLFAGQAATGDIACSEPPAIAIGLIEAIVEREADLIERLQSETETISRQVFESKGHTKTRTQRHEVALRDVGRTSVIASRTRESLVSLGRLLTYFRNVSHAARMDPAIRQRIKTTQQDVQSLAAHVDHLTSRLTFLMDATIGLVGIEQNQIIKLFSVVAVMLMPPTLIASIYGMNFRHMPELDLPWAYPAVLVAMVVSSVIPFLYFKHKGWL